MARTKPRASPSCTMPGCTAGVSEDLAHALVLCESNNGVRQRVMTSLRTYAPTLETESVLRLELEVDDDMELPLVWLIATVFHSIWKLRTEKSRSGPKWKPMSTSQLNVNSAILLDQIVENFL